MPRDGVGEFLLDQGDRKAAIASYEKALEVDPEFENARRMLARIRAEE